MEQIRCQKTMKDKDNLSTKLLFLQNHKMHLWFSGIQPTVSNVYTMFETYTYHLWYLQIATFYGI